MSRISDAIKQLYDELPADVELVAVSKFHPAEAVQAAYEAGQTIFGENRPQEMTAKQVLLPKKLKWHMIGHLQTNKVKMIVPYVSMIESTDSVKLLREIDKQANSCGRTIPCLLEIHVAEEQTKSGFAPDECKAFLDSGEWLTMKNIDICGLMCMASNTDNEARVKKDFAMAARLFDEIKKNYFAENDHFRLRSWGMSHDYKIAISEGSNMVRIGTRIFGERNYDT